MTIFCIGRNYVEHVLELNNQIPGDPVLFLKPATAVLKDNKDFYYPNFTNDLHHEIELVFKIDKKGKSIPETNAWSYISHVTVGIDFTARDLQQKCKEKSLPWEISKAFDHSAVIGQWLPVDELDSGTIIFELRKNGQIVQNGTIDHMIFPLPKLIHYISNFFTINKGDLVFSGTPSGVGPVQIGDRLEGFLNGTKLFDFEVK